MTVEEGYSTCQWKGVFGMQWETKHREIFNILAVDVKEIFQGKHISKEKKRSKETEHSKNCDIYQ